MKAAKAKFFYIFKSTSARLLSRSLRLVRLNRPLCGINFNLRIRCSDSDILSWTRIMNSCLVKTKLKFRISEGERQASGFKNILILVEASLLVFCGI